MARRPVFLSFYYDDDVFRVQQIRNMDMVIEGQPLLSSNEFETIKRKGDVAVRNWIDEQLKYKQCLIVLIGEHTAERPWVQYEIKRAKELGKAMFGIYIHNLNDPKKGYSRKGKNPFDIVFGPYNSYKCYDPQHLNLPGCQAYNTIHDNIANWIDQAVQNKRYAF